MENRYKREGCDFMSAAIIIIPIILTLSIIAAEILIGYRRGLYRNLLRLASLILTAVILLFITPGLAAALTDNDILTSKIKTNLGDTVTFTGGQSDILKNTVTGVSAVLISPILYVALFWLLKLITWIIYAIIVHHVFTLNFCEKHPFASKKYPVAGAVVGGVYALLACALLFMPVSAYSELLARAEKDTSSAESGQGGITGLIGDDNYRLAVGYYKSPAYYFYKYTGTKLVSDLMFDTLSSKEAGEQRISADAYIPAFSKALKSFQIVSDGPGDNMGTQDYEAYINAVDDLAADCIGEDLLIADNQDKLLFLKDFISNNSDFIGDIPLLKQVIENVDYTSLATAENSIAELIDLALLLNNKNLLVLSSDITTEELLGKLDEATVEELADKLYSMDIAAQLVPLVTGSLLMTILHSEDKDENLAFLITGNGDDLAITKEDFIELFNSGKKIDASLKDPTASSLGDIRVFREGIIRLQPIQLTTPETYDNLTDLLTESKTN